MSIDPLYRIRESQRAGSLINLKRFVPLLLSNIKSSSVKLSCQDQRTQTFSETAKILQTTEPICSFFLRGSLLCPR